MAAGLCSGPDSASVDAAGSRVDFPNGFSCTNMLHYGPPSAQCSKSLDGSREHSEDMSRLCVAFRHWLASHASSMCALHCKGLGCNIF